MTTALHEQQDLDRENTFILDCLTSFLYKNSDLIPLAPQELDWQKVYDILIREKLTGLFSHLTKAQEGLWPEIIFKRLQGEHYRQLLYYEWCNGQVHFLLNMFNERQIRFVVLKGWGLVPIVYDGDSSQRTTSDIDILVAPVDVEKVIRLLHDLEYRDGIIEPWPGYYRRYISSTHYLSIQIDPITGLNLNIDLHWGVPEPPYYDRRIRVDHIIERSEALKIAGAQALRLAIEDEVLYTAAHIAHHGYQESLSRYYEIAALILQKSDSIDWMEVTGNASTWHVVLPLKRMISRLSKLWPEIIPEEVKTNIYQLKAIQKELIVDHYLSMSSHTESMVVLLSILNIVGLIDKCRYFLETVFPNREYLEHYFGPAGKIWQMLYFRRFARFFSG